MNERKVYYVSDRRMALHKCEWDRNHIEHPGRLNAVQSKLERTGVLHRCQPLQSKYADEEDLQLVHSPEYIKRIEATEQMGPGELENAAFIYDDIYFNNSSYQAASLSAGCSLQAMQAVIADPERRSASFAVVRPPGHHASREIACGFCIFNNVAICAKKARALGENGVLIIDWDVHAGQGTQYAIADDPKIKLISIHRYEYGRFWPHLPESAISSGYENTINVPLNATRLGDSEYIAFVQHFVVPIINDFKPTLILISAGFDAAFGDEEGGMKVTPAGYYWMTKLVLDAATANGASLCMLMEGGYFVDSVAYGVMFSIKALLGDAGPDIHLEKCNCDFLHSIHSATLFNAQEFPSLHILAQVTDYMRSAYVVPEFAPIKREYRVLKEKVAVYPAGELFSKKEESMIFRLQQKLEEIVGSYTYGTMAEKKVPLAVVTKADEGSNSEELRIEAEGWQLQAIIDFIQVHVLNTPCTKLVLSKSEKEQRDQPQDAQKVDKDESKKGAIVAAISDALCTIFKHGYSRDLEHFMVFDLRLR